MKKRKDNQTWVAEDATIETGLGFEDEPAKERYAYYMRPEPLKDMGPIEKEFDEVTKQEMRYRMIGVGMVRNATVKPEKKVYLDPLPHIRITHAKELQGWYKGMMDYVDGKRPRPCFTDAILTEPYGGYCTVGCSFCYINSGFRGYRGSGLITVPLDYGEFVRKRLASYNTAQAGYFSSFSDPFTVLEDYYHNTQRGAEAFVNEKLPIFFLSRLPYPSWSFDLLKKNKYSYAQKSLNTGSDADYRKLSPAAMSLEDHIAEVKELRKQKIYTSIQVNPVMAGITTHDDIRELFEKLARAKNNHVIVKFVEAGYSWANTMVARQRARFGPRADAFEALFTQNIGGQRTIAEEYRLEAHELYRKWATKLKMTYATCYEYKYERDKKGGIVNKVGVSVGREFATSDQCHGHRVPMFTRLSPDKPFQEVKDCPPSGCLYCASERDDEKAACGNDYLGTAPALRRGDFEEAVYDNNHRKPKSELVQIGGMEE